ncbi:coiled-coil domain-containing protein 55-domain containing protein [Annulohypoxylon maeteangense]|uniref:coiled-coil domain-containing protein 55-domain containing protein n=1 Tax=Annulohypoxylon maeteangense TaxID=1927788 RepID=UPI002007E498|nr:coiled-coil domain-containing protein 55-domain containing protein [Annulohypoxylon maeteangense]KAI0887263.1 coiled-coil domain-containing protein 55-domain containing protein [Annulohypoxylon maeteangense]
MSKPGFSFGLNRAKKPGASKPAPPKRKPMFGGDDDSDNDAKDPSTGPQATNISEIDDFTTESPNLQSTKKSLSKSNNGPPSQPPNGKGKKTQISMYGDLSSSLESRKHQEAAEELDPGIYDYDAVYESLKPEKKVTQEDIERKPKYMKNLIASAAIRKRDALIAEEKKIARERTEEGEEYADKEKFVTEAYKKQQEENRRIEEEERKREEEEAKKNKGGGMTAFYKDLLERGDQQHAEVVKAAEERAKAGPKEDEAEEEKVKTDADVAREINEKGGSIAINEEGQVVDKRLLLKGGLNLGATKKQEPRKETSKGPDRRDDRGPSRGFVGAGGKQAMRERQTRMLEAQLEQSLKRSMEEEEAEKQKVERAAKSRKTESDVSSARERYLARKREAEEAKKKATTEKS